jgi:hypothetical protein
MRRTTRIRHTASRFKPWRLARRRRIHLEQLEVRALLSVNFGPPTNYNASFYANYDIAASDLNGDGKLDLLTPGDNHGTGTSFGEVNVQLGNGDGTFQAATSSPAGNAPFKLAVADFNGDGKPDVATVDEADDTQGNGLSVLLGNGSGGFQAEHGVVGSGTGLSIATGDFNGDGKPDIVDGPVSGGVIEVILGNGDGTCGPPGDYSVGAEAVLAVATGDFNHDGKLDVAASVQENNANTYAVRMMLGNGDGTFTMGGNYLLADGITQFADNSAWIAIGDFNGDGNSDIVTANRGNHFVPGIGGVNDDDVSVLLGNGDGSFQPAVTYPVDSRPFSVAVADFDRDGKQDLVTSTEDTHDVRVLLGNGNGTFRSFQSFAVDASIYPEAVCVGDFNGDGLPDIATADTGSFSESVFLQIPSNQPPTTSAGGPYSIHEGDSLTLDASASSDPDGDPLTYSWDVNGDGVFGDATGVKPTLTWPQLQALGIDDGPSPWNVTVRVSDGVNPPVTSAAATLNLSDTAPTATLSNNGPVNEGTPTTIGFSGQFDPSNADTAAGFHYSYALSPAGLSASYASATDGASTTFTFDDGPTSPTVYGRIFDKDGVYTDYSTMVTVDNVAPTASVSGPADGLTGQTSTFTVGAVDPSSADEAAGFTYTITWGDGTAAQTIAQAGGNGAGVAVDHVYTAVGTYTVQVTATDKDGDTGAAASASIDINQDGTTSLVASSANPSLLNQTISFTVTVSAAAPGSGTPTGTAQFQIDGKAFGSAVTLVNGSATSGSIGTLKIGNHTVMASYRGDTNFTASTAPSLTQVVNPDNTTTILAASVNPSVYGQSVSFIVSVAAVAPGTGTPGGSVTFYDGTTKLSSVLLTGGEATYTTTKLATGQHTITGVYGGNATFATSTSAALIENVNKDVSTIVVTSSGNPSVYGQAVTFTATATPNPPGSGIPTGSVTFVDGLTTLGSATLSGGRATFKTSSLAVGPHSITAIYGGDINFSTNTSAVLNQVVNQDGASTSLISSVNPSVYGQAVTFTARLTAASPGSGTPTGSVTLMDGSSALASANLTSGRATFTTSALDIGSHQITTVYSGDGNFTTSTSPVVTQTVQQDGTTTKLTSSVNPSVFGQAVTFTATVKAVAPGNGTPTGSVTFMDGSAVIYSGALNGSAIATLTTSSLSVGAHAFTAVYGGDVRFTPSTSPAVSQGVNQASTKSAVASSANPSIYGQLVTFTATITAVAPGGGTPTGTVTFEDGSTALAIGTLSGGTASFSTSALSVGTQSITVVYGADSNFKASTSAVLKQVVNAGGNASVLGSEIGPVDLALGVLSDETDIRPLIENLALDQLSSQPTAHRKSIR